jgi:two-component system chemotaxis response regulator CheY
MDKRTFLIVDSKATSIFYTASLLRKLRYIVRTASSGEDALDIISRSAPTCVITDIVLPKMSGLELLKRIKGNAGLRFIPVIINTAEASPAVRDACLKTGCAGYFLKPAPPEELYQSIQAASEATPRKNIRITTKLRARIGTRTEEVTSISIGGLYIRTGAPSPVNAPLALTLLIGSREIKANAVVLYSSEKAGGMHPFPGMGVKFTEIGKEDVQSVSEYIRAELMKDLGEQKA